MRKTNRKMILGGILAATMILGGTGYAYWTDTLKVTATATTGDLDMTFADMGLYAQYRDEGPSGTWSIVDGVSGAGNRGWASSEFFRRANISYNTIAIDGSVDRYYRDAQKYNNVKFDAKYADPSGIKKTVGPYIKGTTQGSDEIQLDIQNMYPGYAQTFRTDVLNVGTLAAKLSNVTFDVSADNDTAENMIGIAVYSWQEDSPKVADGSDVFKLVKSLNLYPSQYFTVGGVDFVRLSALKNIDQNVIKNAITNGEVLTSPATTNRLDIFVGVAMDPDAEGVYTTGSVDNMKENDDSLSQDKNAKVTINFLWDQFNAGKEVNTTNILQRQNADKNAAPATTAAPTTAAATKGAAVKGA